MVLSAFTEHSHSRLSCFADPAYHQALHHLINLMRKQPWIRSDVDDRAGDYMCGSMHDAEVVAGGKTDRRADRRAADAACATRGILLQLLVVLSLPAIMLIIKAVKPFLRLSTNAAMLLLV